MPLLLTCAVLLTSQGCGLTPDSAGLNTGSIELPDLSLSVPAGFGLPTGTSTEVYERIARGVLTCWLGANGRLKATHMFHALSKPPRDGGYSQIALFEKPRTNDTKRGPKAASILISPIAGHATVQFENLRLQDQVAEQLNSDVHRWAAAGEGCVPDGIKQGWEAVAAPPGR